MKGIVQKCLVRCDELKASVIAFPALGTGNLGYPPCVVADIMINTITQYIETNKSKTHIKTIKLVIFSKDDYQKFCKVYANVKLLAKETEYSDTFSVTKVAPVDAHSQATDSMSQVSQALYADTKDSHSQSSKFDDATSTLSQRLKSNTVDSYSTVGTVVVEFAQGDITDDACDVIVNPTNEELCLSSAGQVSNAIRNKGGPELQIICDSLTFQGYRLKSGMVCSTNSTGSLKCKKIFHINALSDSLSAVVFACLQQAELSQLASIAFPAIGSSVLGYDAAKFLCQPVIEFALNSLNHVKIVRFVILQKDMLCYFKQVFNELQAANLSKSVRSFSPMVKPQTHLAKNIPGVTKKPVVQLQVFADKIKKVECAMDRLQQLINEQLHSGEVDDPNISKLSAKILAEIEQEANFRNVMVDCAQGRRQHFIWLKGDRKDVEELLLKIRSELAKINDNEAEQQRIHSTLAKVKWRWEKEPGVFEDYDISLSYKLERAYELNPNGSCNHKHTNGSIETFCFQQMRGQHGNDIFAIQRKGELYKILNIVYAFRCVQFE